VIQLYRGSMFLEIAKGTEDKFIELVRNAPFVPPMTYEEGIEHRSARTQPNITEFVFTMHSEKRLEDIINGANNLAQEIRQAKRHEMMINSFWPRPIASDMVAFEQELRGEIAAMSKRIDVLLDELRR
jgi:hypothetical protein